MSRAAAGGIQSRIAGSLVSISSTGSASGSVSPSWRNRWITMPVQGASKSIDRLGAVDLGQDLPALEAVALGHAPFDDGRLGLAGPLGRQVERHAKGVRLHE